MGLLPPIEIESELSYAYLHAVAARAGMSCEVSGRHTDKDGGGRRHLRPRNALRTIPF